MLTTDRGNETSGTDGLVDAERVAGVLGVSTCTVRRWVREGRIPAYRLGRLVRFDPSETAAWAAAQRREPRSPS